METDMGDDTWYFAYGSNMSIERMKDRTGAIRQHITSRLKGFRLVFNKRADDGGVFANFEPNESSEVWGVAYLCDPKAMKTLDRKEGVTGGHYKRIKIQVEGSAGELIRCVTYVAGDKFVCEAAAPAKDYLQHLLDGARDHNLPSLYIDFIKELGEAKAP